MKILLISPNRLRMPYPVYPLGIEHVAGALAERHQVRMLDLCPSAEADGLEASIREFGPDLVGLSLRNIDNTDATDSRWFSGAYEEVVARIRTATDAPLVLGGAGFTICPEEFMALLDADWGIAGEGERLAELADCLEAGLEPAGIPGLLARRGSAAAMEPWPGSFRRSMELGSDVADFYLKTGGMLNLQTKRGCPHRCVYCTYPSIEGRRIRRFEPSEVAATARRLQDAGARFLFVTDATFNCDVRHNLAVADALVDAGLRIPWGAFFSPIPMPPGYYERLARAGLSHVEFGTEALAPATLAGFGKPFSVEDVFVAHAQALAADMHVAHYFMPGGPDETQETLRETLNNVEALEHAAHFFFCGVRIYPGTALHQRAGAEGVEVDGPVLGAPIFYRAPAMEGVDVEALVKAQARGRLNWIVGSGGERTERILAMMYARGHVGPLWEKLIR